MTSGLAASFLFVLALSGRGGDAETEEVAVGEVNGEVTLRCWNASSEVLVVQWFHGEPGAIPMLFSSDGKLPSDSRFSLVGNSSLHISGLRLEDEGHYLCREILAQTNHTHRIWLRMAGGPDRIEVNISPAGTLPNGTLYAKRHDILNFTCSSDSWPEATTKWDFKPLGSPEELFTEVNSSQSYFVLDNVMPNYQGNYSCLATNLLSQREKSVIRELLIYYPPPSSPVCGAETSTENAQEVQLSCSWPGGYPPPALQWIHPKGLAMDSNTTHFANATVVSLQGSRWLKGEDFVCRGSHIANEERNQNCTLRLERPSVMSNPMKSCFVGRSVELTCELTASNPPAKITWLRNFSKVETEIRSGERFLISQKEGVSSLVIQNCSASRDQGYYICKAENPLGLREVYVHLKVTEPLNIAGIVGSVVVLLLLGVLVFSGILLYVGPQVCLKVNVLRRFITQPGNINNARPNWVTKHLQENNQAQRAPRSPYLIISPMVPSRNRDAGDILELMDSEEEDLSLEAASEPRLHHGMMEGIGNRCPTRSTESSFPETSISLEEVQIAKPTA